MIFYLYRKRREECKRAKISSELQLIRILKNGWYIFITVFPFCMDLLFFQANININLNIDHTILFLINNYFSHRNIIGTDQSHRLIENN